MKGMMLVSHPNVRVLDEHPLDHAPELDEIKRHLNGGYLEHVPGWTRILHKGKVHRCVVFCDEHGKLNALPINHYATVLWKMQQPADQMIQDILVGPVVILYGDDELMAEL